MDKSALTVGIFGGLGLGLLLGSEFHGSIITLLGAIVLVVSLGSMAILSYKKK
ncbi:MAG: hypothetical protein JSW73_03785 [Candidatus Woesearchaeota archaeon]|nr:MAG: hypothetical protein JSW73_03785 [Candidatus Woesearchaeota archaeon]